MKRFIFDSLLNEENICNLESEKRKIAAGVNNGLKLLISGKRNTGKTSLIKNVVAKHWLQKNPSGFFMYIDLMGVHELGHISERFTIAFSDAYNECFRMKATFQSMLKTIKAIKPILELDDTGNPKLSFGINAESKIRSFSEILKQVDLIFKSNIPVLLVLDEFQDIATINEAEAILRNCLQNFDSQIPVFTPVISHPRIVDTQPYSQDSRLLIATCKYGPD